LLQRGGAGDYERVPGWQPVRPGDRAVVHRLDPSRPDALEQANAAYSAAWYASRRVIEAHGPWPDERATLSAWLPEAGARVLETCCGSGRATPAARRRGNLVVGVDIAAPALVEARKAHPEMSWVHGDGRALPFA